MMSEIQADELIQAVLTLCNFVENLTFAVNDQTRRLQAINENLRELPGAIREAGISDGMNIPDALRGLQKP